MDCGAPPSDDKEQGEQAGGGVAIQGQLAITLTTTLNPNTNTYATTIQGSRSLPILWKALNDGQQGPGQGDYIMREDILIQMANQIWSKI